MTVQRVPMNQHHRLTGSVVLVVQVDRPRVLLADVYVGHDAPCCGWLPRAMRGMLAERALAVVGLEAHLSPTPRGVRGGESGASASRRFERRTWGEPTGEP